MKDLVRAVDSRERAVVELWRKGHLSPGTIVIYVQWVRRFRTYGQEPYRPDRGVTRTYATAPQYAEPAQEVAAQSNALEAVAEANAALERLTANLGEGRR